MKNLYLIFLFSLIAFQSTAQLDDGSVAPNWTLVDINGNSHTLYDYLDNGKTVFIDFSATWCSTCWNYHQSGALEDLYQMYGPDGTDEVMVFFIEGEANSNTNCLYDISGCNNSTQGDWTEDVSHPIIDDASINGLYDISGFPTIYGICSNRIITEVGRDDTDELYEFMVEDCFGEVNFSIVDVEDESCFGAADGSINLNIDGNPEPFTFVWSNGAMTEDLEDVGQGTYTCTITNSTGTMTVTNPIEVSGPTSSLVSNLMMVVEESCDGNDGSISIMVSGGNPPYEFDWSNNSSSQNLTNISEGTYTVTITDDNNCENVISNIEVGGSVLPTVSISPSEEFNCNNTQITLSGMATNMGNNPTYQWSTNDGNILSGANSLTPIVSEPGIYTLMVTNTTTDCSSNTSIMVTEAEDLDISLVNQTNIDCNGDNNGFAMVSVSGGNTPYNVSWSNGASGMMNNNLSGGTYMATVTDGDNCTAIRSVTITEPSAINFNLMMVVDESCDGNDGAISIMVSGGNPPYDFDWNNGSSSQNLTNISEGTYAVTLTDDNNCEEMISNIAVAGSILPTLSISPSEEFNCNNTQITLTGMATNMGNNPAYQWSTNNGMILSGENSLTPVISEPGMYSLMVTNTENDCSANTSIMVTEVEDLDISVVNQTNIECNGETDGLAMISVSGGNTPYNVSWSNGTNGMMNNNLSGGTYMVTVTDGDNCTAIQSVMISEPSVINVSIMMQNDVACNGESNGVVNLLASGGTGNLDFLWPDGNDNAVRSDLSAGNYMVSVSDNNDCQEIIMLMVGEPMPLITNISTTGETSLNSNDGTATATPSGGTSPYTYLWSTGSTMVTANNLGAGTYTVTVMDANNCTTIENAIVSDFNCAIAANVIGSNVLCNGEATGSAMIAIEGGTAPFNYMWSTGSNNSAINNLTAGSYSVTIIDASDCPTIESISIMEPSALSLNISKNDETGNNSNDGTAMAQVMGGTSPYTYNWSNGSSMAMISNLSPGPYTVTITDANDCVQMDMVMISAFDCTLSTAIIGSNVLCNGEATGSAMVQVSGGGTAPYNYMWSTGSSNAAINNLTMGDYSVTITDANNCPVIESISITEPSALSLNISKNDETGNNSNDGTAMAQVMGGTSPYTYSWDNGATTAMISNLSSGSYTVTITDANDCMQMDMVMINAFDCTISASITGNNISCNDAADGTAMVELTGGTGPYTYLWSNGENSAMISDLTPGMYMVTVTDVDNCPVMDNVMISEPASLTSTISDMSNNVCVGDSNGSASLSVTGGTEPYNYMWSNGMMMPTAMNLVTGNYQVSIIDANQCQTTESVEIITTNDLAVEVTNIGIACFGEDNGMATIEASSTGGINNYQWSNGQMGELGTNLEPGDYGVTVTDNDGCTKATMVSIGENPEILLTVDEVINDMNNNSEGAINISVNGGTGPYSYLWMMDGNIVGLDEDISNLATGTYNCLVTDSNDCTVSSEQIMIDNVTSINDKKLASQIRLFPNPTSDHMDILMNFDEAYEVHTALYSVDGKILLETQNLISTHHHIHLDLVDFSRGIYFAKIRVGESVITKKVVVQ